VAETSIDIPDRESFKASDVCQIAGLQPYVLRSWEKEFPTLGVTKSQGAPRVYRRADVDLVLRIKQLVFGDGLTLAGARRALEGEMPEAVAEAAAPVAGVSPETRRKLDGIRQELTALLAYVNANPQRQEAGGWPPRAGQPTLLDLSADEHDNGRAAPAAGEPAPAAKEKDAVRRRGGKPKAKPV